MPPEGPLRLIRIGEDRAQAEAVRTLTDRQLAEARRWVRELFDDDQHEALRTWSTMDGRSGWHKLTDILRDVGSQGGARRSAFGRLHGHFHLAGGPQKGLPDATMFRKVLVAAAVRLSGEPDQERWLILMRDTDGSRDVRAAWGQAVGDERLRSLPFTPLLAWFHQEAEAWYLAGFEPHDDAEQSLLDTCRQDLGFDPSRHPERCTAGRSGPAGSSRDAKNVLDTLAPTEDRRARCLQADLERLAGRGRHTGLAAWLTTVRERLDPHLPP